LLAAMILAGWPPEGRAVTVECDTDLARLAHLISPKTWQGFTGEKFRRIAETDLAMIGFLIRSVSAEAGRQAANSPSAKVLEERVEVLVALRSELERLQSSLEADRYYAHADPLLSELRKRLGALDYDDRRVMELARHMLGRS
jgi:hypothetical protein